MTIALVPVVELAPANFAPHRESPGRSGANAPEVWDRYWRDCLRTWGIEGLDPYEVGSWLVPVERLRDDVVLDALLDPYGAGDEDEPPCALNGGFVLEADAAVIRPQCCGDLANLSEWRIGAESEQPGWEMVWIGHPSAYVRAEGARLWFGEPSDTPPENASGSCRVDRDELRVAITEAQRVLDSFAARLRTRLASRMSTRAAERVASALIGRG